MIRIGRSHENPRRNHHRPRRRLARQRRRHLVGTRIGRCRDRRDREKIAVFKDWLLERLKLDASMLPVRIT